MKRKFESVGEDKQTSIEEEMKSITNELRNKLKNANQEHLLKFFDAGKLSKAEVCYVVLSPLSLVKLTSGFDNIMLHRQLKVVGY